MISEDERLIYRLFPGYLRSERTKETGSWIWGYGHDIQKTQGSSVTRRWVCKPCVEQKRVKVGAYESNGINNMKNHLFEEHKIRGPAGESKGPQERRADEIEDRKHGHSLTSRPPAQKSIQQALGLDASKDRERDIANWLIKQFDKQFFQTLLVRWITKRNRPFIMAEDEELRRIFDYLNPAVRIQQAHLSGDSVRAKIIQQYQQHVKKVANVLQTCPGLIHISFDGWTARNRVPLYGIACFFRDMRGKPKKITIGVPELADRHTGKNIAEEVYKVLTYYGIGHKIGYAVLDNAENNDTAMEELGKRLGFDGRRRRGRCVGHTLNLSAKALLFGQHVKAIEDEATGAQVLSDSEWREWTKRGPVGKLHNLVYDIYLSTRLSWWLRELQQRDLKPGKKPLKVIRDNDTRWLSQFHMIRRALELRRYFDLLMVEYRAEWKIEATTKKGNLKKGRKMPRIFKPEGRLSDDDWIALERIAEILASFESVVQVLEGDGQRRRRKHGFEGSYGNSWEVLLGFEHILGVLEKAKEEARDFPDPDHFRIGINLAWEKLDKYYKMLSDTPIYYTPLALHPGYTWSYFEDHWNDRPEWIGQAKQFVLDVWQKKYRNKISAIEPNTAPIAQFTGSKRKYHDPFHRDSPKQRIIDVDSSPRALRVAGDEYEEWLKNEDDHIHVDDPFQYWHERRARFPRLSEMALDFLTIQPMSAECERLFSSAGQMMTPQRTALDAVILSICQCLRSWFVAGVIEDLDPILMPADDEEPHRATTLENDQTTNVATATWLNWPEEKEESVPEASQHDEFLQGIFDIDEDVDAGDNVGESIHGSSQDLAGTPA